MLSPTSKCVRNFLPKPVLHNRTSGELNGIVEVVVAVQEREIQIGDAIAALAARSACRRRLTRFKFFSCCLTLLLLLLLFLSNTTDDSTPLLLPTAL